VLSLFAIALLRGDAEAVGRTIPLRRLDDLGSCVASENPEASAGSEPSQTTPHRVVIAVRSPPVSLCPPATTPLAATSPDILSHL